MKIILLEDVKNLGKKHDVKEVNDGYARNFLIARKLAMAATPQALKELAIEKSRIEKEDAETIKQRASLAESMKGKSLIFELRTDDKGHVFGSVTKEMILKSLRSHGFTGKERVDLKIDRPLKEIGEHLLDLDFKKGIRAKIKIILRSQP